MVTLQKSTQELICQSLRNRIASGDLEPGTELKQVELARTYGVSRMPIREALQTLLLEGLVTRLSNRHMVVAEEARELLGNRKTGQAPVPEAQEPPASPVPVYRVAGDTPVKNVGKIHLLPAREQVASYLRKAILRREIPEGSVLTLEETARHMGVSATPVREALQLLASQGLVKLRPNKGAVVLGMDEKWNRSMPAWKSAWKSTGTGTTSTTTKASIWPCGRRRTIPNWPGFWPACGTGFPWGS